MTESIQAIPQIPTSFYVIAGTVIVMNLGTVVTIIYGIGRLVWFMAKLDSKVKTHDKDINAAHSAIRDVRNRINQTV
jgi:amino acid transporter